MVPPPAQPPHGPAIRLSWYLEWYTLQPSQNPNYNHITFSSARSERSALSALTAWVFALQPSGTAIRTPTRQSLSVNPWRVAPSDDLQIQLVVQGLSRRLGTESKPPLAVRSQHVHFNVQHRATVLSHAPSRLATAQLALANLCELLFWLGWLRSSECFSLRWCNLTYLYGPSATALGLPAAALLLRLLPSTKLDQNRQADVLIAATTASGLSVGLWYWTALHLTGHDPTSTHLVFTAGSTPWTSYTFRQDHLYPLFELQRLQGDPTFRPYSGPGTNTIRHKIYSMGSYHRGGRSHVARERPSCIRAVTPQEIVKHGRWRTRNQRSTNMALHYHEPTLEDRLFITLLCM